MSRQLHASAVLSQAKVPPESWLDPRIGLNEVAKGKIIVLDGNRVSVVQPAAIHLVIMQFVELRN
jgi:hypothetical protein